MSSTHDDPVCLDCHEAIRHSDQLVFAAPYQDGDPEAPSACFHGLCLMRWRDRRGEVRAQMMAMRDAFERHLEGECSCYEDDD